MWLARLWLWLAEVQANVLDMLVVLADEADEGDLCFDPSCQGRLQHSCIMNYDVLYIVV